MLLKKGLILVPAAIFAIALTSNNALYAENATATKDRIKEIKIVEDINIEKLIRSNRTKLASVSFSNYTRVTNITARSLETERVNTENNKQEEVSKKQEEKKTETKTKTNTNTKNKTEKVTKKEAKITKTTKKNTITKVKTEKIKVTKSENTVNKVEQKTETKSTGKIKVSISKSMNLTKRTGLTKEQFKELVKHVSQDTSKFFYNNADYIYDLCAKYQINEIFFCGLISAESGWNIVSNHRKTHNYVSLMSGGKLIHYSSVKEGLTVAAKTLHNNYLTPGGKFYGGKTLAGVQKKYCPSGSWINLVYGRMSQMAAAAKKVK